MKSLAARRRHPAALIVLLIIGLFATGGLYALFSPTAGAQTKTMTAADIETGRKMFLANCASCHGMQAQGTADGPSLVGVGAASVDFQMGTGRMPLAAPSVQAQRTFPVKFNQEQIDQVAAYVQSLGPGPAIPDEQYASGVGGDTARGAQIFLVNCAMCHNAVGAGGALSEGKFAPALWDTTPTHIYEAMLTGPQSMPVFNEANLSPEAKRDVIAYLHELDKKESPGGHSLGNIGPVGDAFFFWLLGIPLMLGAAIWLGRKAP